MRLALKGKNSKENLITKDMSKIRVKFNGRYLAAIESFPSAVEFLEEHLRREVNVSRSECQRAVDELSAWFAKEPTVDSFHTVPFSDGKDLVVSVEARMRF